MRELLAVYLYPGGIMAAAWVALKVAERRKRP